MISPVMVKTVLILLTTSPAVIAYAIGATDYAFVHLSISEISQSLFERIWKRST
jgi:hypothetical protein